MKSQSRHVTLSGTRALLCRSRYFRARYASTDVDVTWQNVTESGKSRLWICGCSAGSRGGRGGQSTVCQQGQRRRQCQKSRANEYNGCVCVCVCVCVRVCV